MVIKTEWTPVTPKCIWFNDKKPYAKEACNVRTYNSIAPYSLFPRNKIKGIKRKAYGFDDLRYFTLKVYHASYN